MNSPIIDMAIVLFFTYLLLSIVASTIYEAILTRTRARSDMLKEAFKKLFFDDEWRNKTSKLLIESPTINALKSDANRFPAYIPAKSFSKAIIGLIRNGSTQEINISVLRQLLLEENCCIKGEARLALLNIMDTCNNDYDKFLKELELFYDDYMDRVSGWFKRKYRRIMFLLSLGIAIGLNVDSIHIAKSLWNDPQGTSEQANQIEQHIKPSDGTSINVTGKQGKTITLHLISHTDTSRISADSAKKLMNIQVAELKNQLTLLNESGIPMGWKSIEHFLDAFTLGPKLMVRITGWLITAFAIFLGAPTWFDILGKLIDLRGVGKKPIAENDVTTK